MNSRQLGWLMLAALLGSSSCARDARAAEHPRAACAHAMRGEGCCAKCSAQERSPHEGCPCQVVPGAEPERQGEAP
jgi:hypothetical protein